MMSISAASARTTAGRSLLFVLICLCLIATIMALVTYLAIDTEQAVTAASDDKDQDTRLAGTFIKRLAPVLRNASDPISIVISQQELNGLTSLGHTVYPWLHTRAIISDGYTRIAASAQLGKNKSWFINSTADIVDSEHGVRLHRVRVGSIPIPSGLSQWLLNVGSRWVVGPQNAEVLLRSIGKTEFNKKRASFEFLPTRHFSSHISSAISVLHANSVDGVDIDPVRVQFYIDHLSRHEYNAPRGHQSLRLVLASLFSLSKQQSQLRSLSAAKENEAAILALAILVGPGIFRHFISGLETDVIKARPRPGLTLGGRGDLAKHFVYSAAIELLSNAGASFDIGQAKELVDSGKHGSGFSFVDLAADRAGIKFAITATLNEASAARIQTIMSSTASEDDFFPSTDGLLEGLEQADFEERFASTESHQYLQVVETIDTRIEQIPLYRKR